MINWLAVIRHLLPDGKAWRTVTDKLLRQFFEGLAGLPADVKTYDDNMYDDLDPQRTRRLAEWEQQWGLLDYGLTEQERRDRLDAAWKAQGGQSPSYIQATLRAAGFDVHVHEWWAPSIEHPTGGSVNGDVTPTARNPFTYLWDGVAPRQYVGCGHDLAYCGGDSMFADSNDSPPGYPLVNKILEVKTDAVGTGHDLAYVGGTLLYAGQFYSSTFGRKQYQIPVGAQYYPYFLYIGGQTFPDQATVPLARLDEFEDLCLKICPTEQWLGILVTYT
jgi:uncharacterized protein YmfQ (DUF2313 family)